MQNQDGQYGTLIFTLFDEKGRPYQFDGSTQHRRDAPRINRNILKTIFDTFESYKPNEEPLTFQMQLLLSLMRQQLPKCPKNIKSFSLTCWTKAI